MSFKAKGRASRTNSGSSSEANVVPPRAKASPNLLTAIFLTEQPVLKLTTRTSSTRAADIRSETVITCIRDGIYLTARWQAASIDEAGFSVLLPVGGE